MHHTVNDHPENDLNEKYDWQKDHQENLTDKEGIYTLDIKKK